MAYPVLRLGDVDDDKKFVSLAQTTLTQRGFPADVDGIFGKGTRKRVYEFQEASSITIDGIIGPDTWERLNPGAPAEPTPPAMGDNQYLTLARSQLGVKELAGAASNPKIDAYFDEIGHKGESDSTAWCAAFVGWVLLKNGQRGTGSLAARSYENWGAKATKADAVIAVFWRVDPNGWQGHVALFVREVGDYVEVIGGNQSNGVTIARYPKAQLLGYRKPAPVPATAPVEPVPAPRVAEPTPTPETPQEGFWAALWVFIVGLFGKKG